MFLAILFPLLFGTAMVERLNIEACHAKDFKGSDCKIEKAIVVDSNDAEHQPK